MTEGKHLLGCGRGGDWGCWLVGLHALGYFTLSESIAEAAVDLAEVGHTASSGSVATDGLLTPVVYTQTHEQKTSRSSSCKNNQLGKRSALHVADEETCLLVELVKIHRLKITRKHSQ